MMNSPEKLTLLLSVTLILLFFPLQTCAAQVDLSPTVWGEEELKKYVRTERIAEPVSQGRFAMVTGTSSSIAIRAGVEALRQGGSAMDAALTTALTHTTLAGGCTVSFAGVLTAVYYDASTGDILTLDGGYNTVMGETDPLTIPRSSRSDPSQGRKAIPKGRTVLVPGFMAGLEAAHARFGKLPFAEIFKPAIYFAEEGFPISAPLSRLAESNKHIISRLPDTLAVFAREDGGFYAPGETFKQPALAHTLRQIAGQGADYFYRGAWADKFVKAVRRDGGKMTMKDMEEYRTQWRDPLHVSYRGHDFYMARGGIRLAGMLNLLEVSDLSSRGHYAESSETFFWFCRIIQAVNFGTGLDGMEIEFEAWVEKDTAKKAWDRMLKSPLHEKAAHRKGDDPHHSDAVVVVDKCGNVAALLHSSNTISFGETGLYIDGISIPDSATFQQAALSFTKPGDRLFNPTVPLIVLKDGSPALGMSAIGSGIYEETVKCIFNIVGFDKSVQEAIDAPSFVPTFGDKVDSPSVAIAVAEGAYPDTIIEKARAKGLSIEVLPYQQALRRKGAVAAVTVDPDTGIREGGSVRRFSLGY